MYLKTWTFSWGQQVACHLGWKGLLGIHPASAENSGDAERTVRMQVPESRARVGGTELSLHIPARGRSPSWEHKGLASCRWREDLLCSLALGSVAQVATLL